MLIIGSQIEKIETRSDRTVKIIIGTNELSPEKASNVFALLQKFCYIAFKVDDFKSDEIQIIDSLESDYEDTSKSQSQRIKSVLYILFKQNNEGFEDFKHYYDNKTEKYIEHLKSKIDE